MARETNLLLLHHTVRLGEELHKRENEDSIRVRIGREPVAISRKILMGLLSRRTERVPLSIKVTDAVARNLLDGKYETGGIRLATAKLTRRVHTCFERSGLKRPRIIVLKNARGERKLLVFPEEIRSEAVHEIIRQERERTRRMRQAEAGSPFRRRTPTL